jgi:hypothetical protein
VHGSSVPLPRRREKSFHHDHVTAAAVVVRSPNAFDAALFELVACLDAARCVEAPSPTTVLPRSGQHTAFRCVAPVTGR